MDGLIDIQTKRQSIHSKKQSCFNPMLGQIWTNSAIGFIF